MRLIINNIEIELDSGSKISRTLQVNDIANLENRQANYSTTFKIPKTANNIRAFNRLGVNGNTSNTPYQRNNAYLYSDNEECLVYDGWAIIKETSDVYSTNIVDGNIDLYKAIENKTLSDLDFTDINHFKTLDTVVNSFDGSLGYQYIIADYNGKAFFDTNKINIDYLVPSVKVSLLWQKIHDTYGFTYSGDVFNTFNFQNLYLTYPKGTADANEEPEEYYANTWTNDTYINDGGGGFFYLPHESPTPTQGIFLVNDIDYIVPSTGTYVITSDVNLSLLVEDQQGNQVNVSSGYEYGVVINNNINSFQEIGDSLYIELNEGDILSLFIIHPLDIISVTVTGDINYGFLSGFNIDFNETLIDFSTRDFIKMVLNRFGLTPFKDKYSNHYEYLTLEQRLQSPTIEDWSRKFVSKNKEIYIYSNYAQKNDFIYKYNDDESDYHDGSILISNVNLKDNKAVIKSKIYAPEKIPTDIFERSTKVYKLWDKEVKDDGSVTYKELDKRFYLMRSDNYTFENQMTIGSELLQTEQTISVAPFESFFKLPFNDIISDYYTPIYQILDKARVENHNIYLTQNDIVNIDFKSLKWIEELSSYFLLNKISNFSEDGIIKCEMIKVDYVNTFFNEDFLYYINSFAAGCLNYSYESQGIVQVYYSDDNGETFQPLEAVNGGGSFVVSGQICGLTLTVGWLVKLYNPVTQQFVSNTFEIV